jgi:hypothetical protein
LRELRFRQYNPRSNSFHYWGYIDDDTFISPIEGSMYAQYNQQYIGLNDRNGREIYEGDIVEIPAHWSQTMSLRQVVEYVGATFYPFDDSDWGWGSDYSEVIGNIHENPELLEGLKNVTSGNMCLYNQNV